MTSRPRSCVRSSPTELRSVGGASGAWVFDVDANGDGQLYGNDADERRIPASNEKLFTTAAFLVDARARRPGSRPAPTPAASSRAAASRRSTATWCSSATAIPTFGTARFARAANQPVTRVSELARDVHRAGIRKITGRVLADDSIFDRERRAGPDLSPLSGLSFNDGYDGGHYAHDPELVAAAAMKKALRKQGISDRRPGRARQPARPRRSDATRSPRSPRRRSRG